MSRSHDKTNGFLLPNVATCIIACSTAEARFYLAERRFGDWRLTDTLSNPLAAVRERNLVSDRPGRAFDRFGKGRHAMSAEESARTHEIQAFAHEIAQQLGKAQAAGRFSKLVVIAEPSFLGHLRHKLSAPLKRALCCEVPKNPADFDQERLRALFA